MLGGVEGVSSGARGMRVNATGASLSRLLSALLAAIARHSTWTHLLGQRYATRLRGFAHDCHHVARRRGCAYQQ
jgi:hypothetical protein